VYIIGLNTPIIIPRREEGTETVKRIAASAVVELMMLEKAESVAISMSYVPPVPADAVQVNRIDV